MNQAQGIASNVANDARTLCKRTWWVFLIGGIAAVLFGIGAFVQPGIALLLLATFFAVWVLVDGAFNIVGSLRNRDKDGWWIMLLIGILGVVVGCWALLNPPLSMIAFIYIVAAHAVLLGAFLVMLGVRVRKATTREWVLYLAGALSILFGILVIVQPAAGGLSIVWVIASWAIVIGILRIVFAFKIKNLPEAIGGVRAA